MTDQSDTDAWQIIEDCTIGEGTEVAPFAILDRCKIGDGSRIWNFTNLYGCQIGDDCMIGTFVEIQEDVTVGDGCRIQSHAFVCSLVTIEDDVFVSHGVKFINDRYPPTDSESAWEGTLVREGAAIGTNATILPVEIGKNALIGAGAVVTEDVPAGAVVAGNPAEVVAYRDDT